MVNTECGTDVIVIGGGLAGLAAATYLGRTGLSVRVLERASALGGRAATRVVQGFSLNRGPHALYRRGVGVGVLSELGVSVPGHPVPARGKALRNGRLYRLPVDATSLLGTALLDLPGKVAAGRFLATLPSVSVDDLADVSVAEWLERAAPDPSARQAMEAYVRVSTYANAPHLFSAKTAALQLKRALGGVLYVDGGWQTLVDGLAARARTAGVDVRNGAPAHALERLGQRAYAVVLADGRRLEARAVVLAVPPDEALRLAETAGATLPGLGDTTPVRMASLDVALARLPRKSPRFILGMDQPLYLSLHSDIAKLGPEGGAVIHAGKYLRGDEVDPDADRRELEGLLDLAQPGWRSELVHAQYLPRMTAVSRLDLANERGAEGRPSTGVEALPGVFVAGDWVKCQSWLADASLETARLAAAAVAASLGLARAVA